MTDLLGPRLERLQELSAKLNAAADETARNVRGVEIYLSDKLNLGVRASVTIEVEENPEEQWRAEKELVYGRHGPKYRIFVTECVLVGDTISDYKETPWANCRRDIKFLAYNYLPALLDELASSIERTLKQVEVNTETIQALVPLPKKVAHQ